MIVTIYKRGKDGKKKEVREPCVNKVYVKDGVLYLEKSIKTIGIPLHNIESYKYF